jgi:hypothetical protein
VNHSRDQLLRRLRGLVYGTGVFTAEAEMEVVRALRSVSSAESKKLLDNAASIRVHSSSVLDTSEGNWYRCPVGHVSFKKGWSIFFLPILARLNCTVNASNFGPHATLDLFLQNT